MHHDYLYQSGIAVACDGPSEGITRTSPIGSRRSRDGAQLENVLADARYWQKSAIDDADRWDENRQPGDSPRFFLLNNPTHTEVIDALTECGAFLRQFEDRANWGGGSIHLAFSGHGTKEGNLVLADGELSPDELMEVIAASIKANPLRRRRVGFVFDSCFSGRTLARIIVHPLHGDRISIPDGFAAALHDESAWEFDFLQHGAFTFTMANPGNAHVDHDRLAKAVEQGDERYLRLALQGFVPNPVTYLTEGDQHSLDLTNGHRLEIKGWGVISVGPNASQDELLDALHKVRSHSNPGGGIRIGWH